MAQVIQSMQRGVRSGQLLGYFHEVGDKAINELD